MKFSDLALPFKENEIEWRIAQAGKNGSGKIWAKCLAYVSARAILDRLDSVCGPNNWKVSYRFIPGATGIDPGVICELSILCGDVWVTKEDGAEQTDIESFKGGISSALKRAGSAWGIGRYLYGLEEGWAEIVQKGTKDERYAKHKDGWDYYWVPPSLPAWALPAGHPVKEPLPRIKPEAPSIEDGFGIPTEYRIGFGQWKGRGIDQVYRDKGPNEIAGYIDYLEKKALKDNKPMGAEAAEFVERAAEYLGMMENVK